MLSGRTAGQRQAARSGRGSIARRLVTTVLATSGLALLLACGVFVANDIVSFRSSTVRDVTTLADVIGRNTVDAVRFDDPQAAAQTLASLRAAPEAIAAAIYDSRGRVFASWQGEERGQVGLLAPRGGARGERHRFGLGHLDVWSELNEDGETLGTIAVRWDTAALTRRAQNFVVIVAALLLIVFGVARFIAAGLRNRVAQPLATLADSAQSIAEGRLDAQIDTAGDAEIHDLATAFNEMTGGLRELIARARENTQAVADVASTLREGSKRMTEEAARQARAVEDATRSSDEVTGSVTEVNGNVQHLAGRAQDTSSAIMQMDSAIAEVAASMDRLAESIEGAASGTTEMARSVREIGSAMESLDGASSETATRLQQLVESVAEVEGNAKESGALSTEAREEASRGARAVDDTIASMEEIRTSFSRIQSSVGGLAEKSSAIGEILRVIEDVLEQTNMLSINAAIIASQAGEHGRGFAVVADEIKTLSSRTARSTREIAGLIQAVQEETTSTVQAVEAGSETVERGVARSGEAGGVLRAIMETSDRTASRIGDIVEATVMQSAEIRDVESAMTRVRTLVATTNHAAHEHERAGGEIARAVEQIRDLGRQVKTLTDEQRHQSRVITGSVADVAAGVNQILQATRAQTQESEKIQSALGVFRQVAKDGAERGESFHRLVEALAERSDRLESAIGRFAL